MSRWADGLGTRIAAVARWKAIAESRAVGMTSWGSPMSKAKTDTAATPDLLGVLRFYRTYYHCPRRVFGG